MNLIEYMKNIIKFRRQKALGMSYSEFFKQGVFEEDNQKFSDEALNKFERKEDEKLKHRVFNEFNQSIIVNPIIDTKKIEKMTNDKYDELSKKADEKIRTNRIISSEDKKQIKLTKFFREDEEK